MNDYCTVIRDEENLQKLMEKVQEWKRRYESVSLADTGMWTNQNLSFTRALGDMIIYAEAIVLASIERKESRGCHYRTDFTERVDEPYLKTSLVKYDAAKNAPVLELEDVPLPMVKPRVRSYGKK